MKSHCSSDVLAGWNLGSASLAAGSRAPITPSFFWQPDLASFVSLPRVLPVLVSFLWGRPLPGLVLLSSARWELGQGERELALGTSQSVPMDLWGFPEEITHPF